MPTACRNITATASCISVATLHGTGVMHHTAAVMNHAFIVLHHASTVMNHASIVMHHASTVIHHGIDVMHLLGDTSRSNWPPCAPR
jgi:hypothetical protein